MQYGVETKTMLQKLYYWDMILLVVVWVVQFYYEMKTSKNVTRFYTGFRKEKF